MAEKKKKKDSALKRFIMRSTGADKVVEGLEGKTPAEAEAEKKRKKPKDTRGMIGMRIAAGRKKKVEY